MLYFTSIIHALTCIFIVVFILLQDPKGGVLGNLGGGGGSKSLFGSQGAGGFLVTATKWLAIMFALTSITLSYISSLQNKSSLMEAGSSVQAPVEEAPLSPEKKSPDTTPLKESPPVKKPSGQAPSLENQKNTDFKLVSTKSSFVKYSQITNFTDA